MTGARSSTRRAPRSISTRRSCARMGRATKSMRFRSPTGRSSPAGPSMSRPRSAEVSSRRCRTSAAHWRVRGQGVRSFQRTLGRLRRLSRICCRRFRKRAGQSRELLDASSRRRHMGARRHPGDGKSLFAATGNTFRAIFWSYGEAVLRLGPDLARSRRRRRLFRPVETGSFPSSRPRPRRNRADPARRPNRQRRTEADPGHRQKRRPPIFSTAITSAASAARSLAHE